MVAQMTPRPQMAMNQMPHMGQMAPMPQMAMNQMPQMAQIQM